VLCDLMDAHAGNPPIEALEQAGFRRHDISDFLQRRAGTTGYAVAEPGLTYHLMHDGGRAQAAG
jgi:hypothetical protein